MLQKRPTKNLAKFKYLVLVPVLLGILIYTSCQQEPQEVEESGEMIVKENTYFSKAETACLNFSSQYAMELNNYLKITNGNTSSIIVKLVSLETEEIVRSAYLQKGESYKMKHIPEGKYRIDDVFGENYTEKQIDGQCVGSFDKILITEKGEDILDYNTVTTAKGLSIPSYALEIDMNTDENLNNNSNNDQENQENITFSEAEPECLNKQSLYNKSLDNYLKIKMGEDTEEALIKIKDSKNNQTIRTVYLKKNDIYMVKNIPGGNYNLSIVHGSGFKIGNNCKGSFKTIIAEEDGNENLNYNPTQTKEGLDVPSYTLALNINN